MFLKLISAILFFSLIILSSEAMALNDTESGLNGRENKILANEDHAVDLAYRCLDNQIKDKTKLSLEQAIFSTYAVGSKDNLQESINAEKNSIEECWPKNKCNIKETAQVLLAYNRINKDTGKIEKWLLSKNGTSNELIWYLEVDIPSRNSSVCEVSYENKKIKVNIDEDMKIRNIAGGECFTISRSGYWLQIKNSCLDKDFEISCDQDFVTSLVYEKKSGGTVYVLSESHSSVSGGTTDEHVKSNCFKLGNSCDYEGSLWAVLSLYKIGKSIGEFIPYLLAFSEDNTKYFPSSFLYILAGGDERYSDIIQQQKSSGYWDVTASPYKRYYDTSLAMLAISSGGGSSELEITKEYLLQVQGKEGCWNSRDSIVDTGFILYSGWPKTVGRASNNGGTPLCEEVSGQSCEIGTECIDAGGRILNNFACSGFGVCCSLKVPEQKCAEKNGIVCASTDRCNGREESSAEGSCCVDGSCVPIEQISTCEANKGRCAASCEGTEEEIGETCPVESELCCKEKEQTEEGGYSMVIILIILIILVILAIVFRHKLQLWWFNFSNKRKGGLKPTSPPNSGGPGASRMPQGPIQSARPRYITPSRFHPAASKQIQREKSDRDKELEETLKKLKDMGA